MTVTPEAAKAVVAPFAAALYDFDVIESPARLAGIFGHGAKIRLPYPFDEAESAEALWGGAYRSLSNAWPDLERRAYIRIAGADRDGAMWVGEAGYYTGTFTKPWLLIPPTQRTVHMRFHEFFRVEGTRVVESQFGWDIPEVMMQAGAWPMVPSLGREWCVPGPASQDGLGPHTPDTGDAAMSHVLDMLGAMSRHPREGGPEVMEMPRYWHPKMHWYGPAGIGTARGIEGFRRHHQIPFLGGMPDRGKYRDEMGYHFFAEGDYVGVTGWPNMKQSLSHPGWLGLPGTDKTITMKSLDFWRLENGLIRENWVLVDLLDVYQQLGINVFERMEALG